MIETLPYGPFIPPQPHKLILGSFPCFNGTDYGDFFYSGSGRNFFWPLLSDVSGMPATNRQEKEAICIKLHLALTDVALKIERLKGNCSDANLRIIELNKKDVQRCLDSGVSQVLHTSQFVKRQFDRMFPDCKIPTAFLPSPSPASNRHIGGLEHYLQLKKSNEVDSVYTYRLRAYKELLL